MVFENYEIVLLIIIPTFGGLFYKTSWFKASLYIFLIFWNFEEIGFSVLKNFKIIFWIKISTFRGVCYIKLFDLRPPYIYFWFFGNLGGLFWVRFLVFKNFEIIFWIKIPIFGGLFYTTFWLEASLYVFLLFGTLEGLF